MDYKSALRTLNTCIKRIEIGEQSNVLNATQKLISAQQKKDLADLIHLTKRVHFYGGINSLLDQAAKAQNLDKLFTNEPDLG